MTGASPARFPSSFIVLPFAYRGRRTSSIRRILEPTTSSALEVKEANFRGTGGKSDHRPGRGMGGHQTVGDSVLRKRRRAAGTASGQRPAALRAGGVDPP